MNKRILAHAENAIMATPWDQDRNKLSAMDPEPQVDLNWYAYNGETMAKRDRATARYSHDPCDPVGTRRGRNWRQDRDFLALARTNIWEDVQQS